MEINNDWQIRHDWADGPELLTSYYVSEEAKAELHGLEPVLEKPSETGSAKDEEGNDLKDNRGIYFNKVFQPLYAECSPTSRILESFIAKVGTAQLTPNSAFNAMHGMKGFDLLFSAYRNGDYYEAHRDESRITVLFWLGEKDFEGGDLYLPDFDYMIPYEQYRITMFPSYYRHEVTKISTEKEGFVRYCASAFIV